MDHSHQEKRQFGAMRVMAQVPFTLEGSPTELQHTINISQSGFLARAPEAVKVQDYIRIELRLPPHQTVVQALGRIARIFVQNGESLMGVQFLEMSDQAKDQWLTYMATIESLSSNREEVTSSSVLLEERRKEGRNRQTFLLRFDGVSALESFVSQHLLLGRYHFDYAMARSPGDLVSLILVHPVTDSTLEIEAQIQAPETPEDYSRLTLSFATFTLEQHMVLDRFVSATSAQDTRPEESTSELDETVLMDPIHDKDLQAKLSPKK